MNDDVQATMARLRGLAEDDALLAEVAKGLRELAAKVPFGPFGHDGQHVTIERAGGGFIAECFSLTRMAENRDIAIYIAALLNSMPGILDALDAERAARVQAEEFRDEALRDGNEMLRELQKVAGERDAAAANEAALREAGNYLLEGERLGRVRLTVTYSHDDIDYIRNLEAALATSPSAAAERVQRVVAAAERICEADKRGDAAMQSRDYSAADASFDALSEAMSDLHAALDGGKEAQ